MSQRLSRKQIKRDGFAEAVGRSIDYVSSHTRLLVLAAVALVVVAVAIAALIVYSGKRQEMAAEELDRAITVYRAPIDPLAAAPDDPEEPMFADEAARRAAARERFAEVVDRFGGTEVGSIAHVYLGRIAAAEGDLDTAGQHWREFLDQAEDHALAAEVELNLLQIEIAQGRSDEAAARLEELLADTDAALPQDVVLYELARLREKQGDGEGATTAYQRLVDEYPGSPYGPQAQRRLDALASS